ncbi:hypothetical protein DFJ74DRAFT_757349, partial [Hyaloraphidium curvatum]
VRPPASSGFLSRPHPDAAPRCCRRARGLCRPRRLFIGRPRRPSSRRRRAPGGLCGQLRRLRRRRLLVTIAPGPIAAGPGRLNPSVPHPANFPTRTRRPTRSLASSTTARSSRCIGGIASPPGPCRTTAPANRVTKPSLARHRWGRARPLRTLRRTPRRARTTATTKRAPRPAWSPSFSSAT